MPDKSWDILLILLKHLPLFDVCPERHPPKYHAVHFTYFIQSIVNSVYRIIVY